MLAPRPNSALRVLFFAAIGAACLVGLRETGLAYRGFPIRQEGVNYVHESELVHDLWYALWGTLATTFFTLGLMHTLLAERTLSLFARSGLRPWRLVVAAAVVAIGLAAALHRFVLLGHPVADDESVLAFQAQTLLRGRILNPLPEDPEFFANQYVLLDSHGWYGKYPIGHPLVLALGEAFGVRWLVGPVLAGLAVLLTFAVGRKLFGAPRAAAGAALLCLSPEFVSTHATGLSQTTSSVVMLAGSWAVLRLRDDPSLTRGSFAGLVWGFALVVRPMPGALFLLAALAGHLFDASQGASLSAWRARAGPVLAAVPGVVGAIALLAWLNQLQTGSPTTSSYGIWHGNVGVLDRPEGLRAMSLGAALLRQNFWLFGWTCSLAFIPFARPRRASVLFWGLVAASYGYRLLVPKTVLASTGPIYVFESVPLLTLATVDGAARVAELLGRLRLPRPRAWIASTMIAASAVAACAFAPTHGRALLAGAWMRERVYVALEQEGAQRALVFANRLVEPEWGTTWAYYPPNPSPDLDDAVLFARFAQTPAGLRAAHAFWRRRFPDRRAFLYVDGRAQMLFQELRRDGEPEPPGTRSSD